jgi:hypothetical protein
MVAVLAFVGGHIKDIHTDEATDRSQDSARRKWQDNFIYLYYIYIYVTKTKRAVSICSILAGFCSQTHLQDKKDENATSFAYKSEDCECRPHKNNWIGGLWPLHGPSIAISWKASIKAGILTRVFESTLFRILVPSP